MTKMPFRFLICLALLSKGASVSENNNSKMVDVGIEKRNFVDLFVDTVCTFCNILITCCHKQNSKLRYGDSLLPTTMQNHHQLPPDDKKTFHKINNPLQKPQQNNPSQPNLPINNPQNFNLQNLQQNILSTQNDIPLQNSQGNLQMQNPQYDNSALEKPIHNTHQKLNPSNVNENVPNLQNVNSSQTPLALNNSQANLSKENLLTNNSSIQHGSNQDPPQNLFPITSQLNSSLQSSSNNNPTAQIPQQDNPLSYKPPRNPIINNSKYDNPQIPNSQHHNQLIKNSQNENPSISTPENNNQLNQDPQHNTLLPSSNNVNQLPHSSKIPFSNAQNNGLSPESDSPSQQNSQNYTTSLPNPQYDNPSLQNVVHAPYLDLTNNSQNSQFEISNDPNKLPSEVNKGSVQQDQDKSHDSQFPPTSTPIHFAHPKLEQKLPLGPYLVADKPNKVQESNTKHLFLEPPVPAPTRPVGI